MPEAVPLLLAAQAAVKPGPEPAASLPAAAGGAETPFTQALAQQLASAAQNTAHADAQGKARAAAVPVADGAAPQAPLPPDGDVLPPALPPGLILKPIDVANGSIRNSVRVVTDPAVSPDAPPVVAPANLVPATLAWTPILPHTTATPAPTLPTDLPDADSSAPGPDAKLFDAARVAARPRGSEGAPPGIATGQSAAPGDPHAAPDALLAATLVQKHEAAAAAGLTLQQEVRQIQAQRGADAAPTPVLSAPAAVGHDARPQRVEAPVLMQVSVPLQDPGWSQALGQRVLWMVKHETQSAELRINPPGLGQVEMRVALNGNDQARVSFTSPHAEVRDALEAAFPRLRDMLGANGLVLADVDVSAQSFSEQRQAPDYRGAANPRPGEGGPDRAQVDAQPQPDAVQGPAGLLDLYA